MPDIAAAFPAAPVFRLRRTADFPQNPFRRRNLIGAHNQQRVACIKNRIMKQHIQQRIFQEKRRGKIL